MSLKDEFGKYLPEVREKLVAAVRNGKLTHAAAAEMGVNQTTAGNWTRAAGLGRKPPATKKRGKKKASADAAAQRKAPRKRADKGIEQRVYNLLIIGPTQQPIFRQAVMMAVREVLDFKLPGEGD